VRLSPGTGRSALALAAVLGTSAAFAAEFSVRLDDVPANGMVVRVRLVEACAPYDCGRDVLAGRASTPVSAAFAVNATVEPGRDSIRGQVPAEPHTWWVVVHAPDRLPLAILWRPPVANGHLPPVPPIPRTSCGVAVTDADGNPVGGARVVPAVVEVAEPLRPLGREGEAVFPG